MNDILNWKQLKKRRFLEHYYDAAFLLGLICCSLVGRFPQLTLPLSGVMVLCFASSFFSDNLFLYEAIFLFMQNKMVIGSTTAYRFYSYLLVLRFLLELPRFRFRLGYIPPLIVFALHCVLATGQYDMRLGLNVIVDVAVVYIVLACVLRNDNLTRKFMLAFLLGMVISGVYGFTAVDSYTDITITGGGSENVNRNFGSLGDSNYAGFFYDRAFIIALTLKGIPIWLNVGFAAFALVRIVRTASLSALLVLVVLICALVILKMKKKAIPILLVTGAVCTIVIAILMSIPAFRNIPQISGLLLRIVEKLRYLQMGRFDLLTTERAELWTAAMNLFDAKSITGKLFGGSVITVALNKTKILATNWACHQSYIQALVNFGIVGLIAVYLPVVVIFIYRLCNHMLRPSNYENSDIKIIQLMSVFAFLVFGATVDFFVEWRYLFFLFI